MNITSLSRLRGAFGRLPTSVEEMQGRSPTHPRGFTGSQTWKPEDSKPKSAKDLLLSMFDETSQSERDYDDYLKSQPTRKSEAPSGKRRFLAALAGAGAGILDPGAGFNISSRIVSQPYETAIDDWEAKRQPLANAAQVERANKTTKVNALKSYIDAERNEANDRAIRDDRVIDNTRADRQLDETIRHNTAMAGDRAADNTRQAESDRALEAHRKSQLEIDRGRLAVSQQQANTTASRVSVYKSSVEGLNAYREHLRNKVAAAVKAKSPTKASRELAEIEVVMKPGNSQKYADFYKQGENGKIVVEPPEKGWMEAEENFSSRLAEYVAFQGEIKNEHDRITGGIQPNPPKVTDKTKSAPAKRVVRREAID